MSGLFTSDSSGDMMTSRIVFVLLCSAQTLVWCSPNPQGGTAQVSLNGSPSNGVLLNANLPRPVASGSVGVTSSGGTGAGGVNANMGVRPQRGVGVQYEGGSGNFPVPFNGNLLSSGFGLGSSAVHAKTQSASAIMDGMSYGIGRVPSYIGYGVQSAGRLEKTGEQLFKAAVDLGTGGLSNGMQGLTLGMNVMNGLGTAGMKGLGKVANGSAQILEHILSLSVTESGLFNTLVALSRLMSPALGSFLSSGLNLTSLANAANYLGIPTSNVNLNTILDSASRLQTSLNNAGINANSISSAANSASSSIDAIRQAASAAVQNLGLSSAWNILSSRLPGGAAPSLQAAVNSNSQLPVSASVTGPGVSANGQLTGSSSVSTPGNAAVQVAVPNSGSSWTSWLG